MRLGEISYSIYLLHGIILFWINKSFMSVSDNIYAYQAILFLETILTLLVSCVGFVLLEKKGVKVGRYFGKAVLKK